MDHTYASAIVGAQQTWERKPADFYPTPPDVTVALLDFLALPPGQSIWEPACGDGAMAKVLGERHKVLATDLREDSGYGAGGMDFLAADISESAHDWIITNPPFKLAADFIEKSLKVTGNVAMLLKSQYWHAKSRIALFEKHPPAYVLPLTWRPSFLEKERGNSPLMDVIWVVWSQGYSGPTKYAPLRRPAIKKPSPVDILTHLQL